MTTTGIPMPHITDTGLIAQLTRERNALREANADLRRSLSLDSPTLRFGWNINKAWSLLVRIAQHDWLDDPAVMRSALDDYVNEARALTLDPKVDPTGPLASARANTEEVK